MGVVDRDVEAEGLEENILVTDQLLGLQHNNSCSLNVVHCIAEIPESGIFAEHFHAFADKFFFIKVNIFPVFSGIIIKIKKR